MTTVWVRNNRRALLVAAAPFALLAVLGLLVAADTLVDHTATSLRIAGGSLAAVCALIALALSLETRRPRLALANGALLVYLRFGPPHRVPLPIVECFLMGHVPTELPGQQHKTSEARSLVIRLSESAEDWQKRDVHRLLGSWCGGYITLRGTWCEPLNVSVVRGLNEQLEQAQRNLRTAQACR